MTPIPLESVASALQWRYATKKFDSRRRIPAEVWRAMETALVLAPSSFGLQPWRFIVVTNEEKKRALVPHSWMQSQPADCSHHVVFAVRKGMDKSDVDRYIQRIVEVRGGSREALEGFEKAMLGSIRDATSAGSLDNWASYQVYIALGQFMATAAFLKVDTCPMEGIVPAGYDKVLALEGSGYATLVACAAGYRTPDDRHGLLPKVRFPHNEVVIHI